MENALLTDFPEHCEEGILREPASKSGVIVIDNGVYEIKAGYIGDPCFIARNRIYKSKGRVSLEPFPLATMRTMFENDVIVSFDVLEHTVDVILGHLRPEKLDTLLFTVTPHSPSKADLIDFIFSVYTFSKVQLCPDYIYTYHKYFDGEDCLIIAMNYSAVFVAYIQDREVQEERKINFGGRDLMEYINFVMTGRYRDFKKDYRGLAGRMRVSQDYRKESLDIYSQLCAGDYSNNIFLTRPAAAVPQAGQAKKARKAPGQPLVLPPLDHELLGTDDGQLDADQLKEKRKQKMAYCGLQYRLRMRIEKAIETIGEIAGGLENEIEKRQDLGKYIAKMKGVFSGLKRELELREKLRGDAKNRKTKECLIKNKEGVLDAEEQKLRESIADAEDEAKEAALLSKIDSVCAEILELDPEFIPFHANTVDLLRGDHIGRQCVNVDLLKWPEIFFYPSLISSEEMGLVEIINELMLKYQIKNALICGGFSFIAGLEERIRNILCSRSLCGEVNVRTAKDSRTCAFEGAKLSPLYPVYTREDYEKHGAEKLANLK